MKDIKRIKTQNFFLYHNLMCFPKKYFDDKGNELFTGMTFELQDKGIGDNYNSDIYQSTMTPKQFFSLSRKAHQGLVKFLLNKFKRKYPRGFLLAP